MKIMNIMLSRDLGGIQQSFLDYAESLRLQEFDVVNVTSIFAKINKLDISIKIPNLGSWDIFSKLYLKLIIFFKKPNIIIAHGNRAIKFSLGNKVVIIGIAHNYNIKWLIKCDYIIALTKNMSDYLVSNEFPKDRISIIPNMIKLRGELKRIPYRSPLIIGALGRFVTKKGFAVLLQALAKLKNDGYNFKALIGGDGPEKDNLLKLTRTLNIDSHVSFVGWVTDRMEFFQNIDIFCLPSLHEPFGIIALEAMANKVPIITTRTEGPLEIIRDNKDGIFCAIYSSDSMAEQISFLIENPKIATEYAKNSYQRIVENYDIKIVSLELKKFLTFTQAAKKY